MTDHSGVVMQGFANTDLNDRRIASLGHLVSCQKCKGVFPIGKGNHCPAVRTVHRKGGSIDVFATDAQAL
ncbi:PAAR domain-containing protein [Cupriavidus sp. USMAHM13]|uniref:PAAR domain-containing protein n=1 Tax=Cupriavidus sp. USMAHM13 TaxID=1389192 RepID=UPI0012EAE733|nr:PAAR domain-containing protein [Cupriavidus sp. USMAHM13]